MKKLIIISVLPVPYLVKYTYALQKYFNFEYWFYTDKFGDDYTRPEWWKTKLGEKCLILKNVLFARSGRCLTLNILTELKRFDPDIIMLAGFIIPSNYLAYLWARQHKKKVIVFCERSRTKN